jgi:hypothetical protein
MSAADTYTPQQLAMFAEWVASRAAYRPAECHYSEMGRCWVREGPPAIEGQGGRCIGCQGLPSRRLRG